MDLAPTPRRKTEIARQGGRRAAQIVRLKGLRRVVRRDGRTFLQRLHLRLLKTRKRLKRKKFSLHAWTSESPPEIG